MDLVCVPASKIGMMISAYFIGFIVGGLFYALPDKYGRRKAMIFGTVLACLAQCLLLLSHTILARSAGFFLLGCA